MGHEARFAADAPAHPALPCSARSQSPRNRWQPLFTEPLRLEKGCVVLSENPGIGLDLDRKALGRFKT
jgi:L-alanine-DL-glutamate epimerase-like enolase superfamily enzyme